MNDLQLESASLGNRRHTVELEFGSSVDVTVHGNLLSSVSAVVACKRPAIYSHDLIAEPRSPTGITLSDLLVL